MLGRFPRIIGVAAAILICLAWLFHGGSQTHLNVLNQGSQLHAPQAPSNTNGQAQPEEPQRARYADLVSTSTTAGFFAPAPTGNPVINRKSPYAYVFYATSDEFACSALVNAQRIIDFHTPHPLYIFLTENVKEEYKKAFENINVTVFTQAPPVHPNPTVGAGENRKENSLLKLQAFRMHQIDQNIKRVLFLDADQFIYHSLDPLFELPDVDVAAPRAYWKGSNQISTTLMLISVNERVWQSVDSAMKALKVREYDFELVNSIFGATAMILPGQYATPDEHWVSWTLPRWYRPEGAVVDGGMIQEYSKSRLEDLWQAININVNDKSDPHSTQSPSNTPPQPSQPSGFVPPGLQKREEPAIEASKDTNTAKEDLGEILTPEEIQKEEEAAQAEGFEFSSIKNEVSEPANDEKAPQPAVDIKDDQKSEPSPEEKATSTSTENGNTEMQEKDTAGEKAKANADEKSAEVAEKPEKKIAEDKPEKAEQKEAEQETSSSSTPTPAPSTPKQPPPWPYTPDEHPDKETLNQLHYKVFVLHYGAVYFPWEKHVNGFKEERPNVHPAMYEQFKHWRENAQKVCPRIKREKKDHGPGEDAWEWWRPVNDV